MDSPLTVSELSRLRKALQQRERLVAQGATTSGVDLKISRSLSNLKLYLPSQTHLTAVHNDWETSDATKKSQIIIWLQHNILNDLPSQEKPSAPAAQPRPAFVHPPPPPALLSRTGSVVSKPDRPASLSGTPPISASAGTTPVPTPPNTNNVYPPREIHTQARFKPPTPPPKDRISRITHESLTRRHTFAGRPQHSRQSSGFVESPTSDRCADSPMSNPLYPSTFVGYNSSQPGVVSPNSSNPTDSARRFGTQVTQAAPTGYGHTTNPLSPHVHDSNQYHAPPGSAQPTLAGRFSSNPVPGYANPAAPSVPGIPGGPISYIQRFIDAWKIVQQQQAQQTQQAQQNSALMQQLLQTQQTSAPNTTAQILAAAQQQQAQLQADFLQQLQTQQTTPANDTAQLLANLQQQQQAQTNQMISILQQYQQTAPNFNPDQNLQQSQQMLDLLSQMQSGGAPGVDWASLASGSGMDTSTLMSMAMGGMDPTTLMTEGASFMFG